MINAILIGKPGCGKSSLATHLSQRFNVPSIKFSDLLRAENTVQAQKVLTTLDETGLVSYMVDVIGRHVPRENFILDGYPRSLAQLNAWDYEITDAFYLRVSDEVALERQASRNRSDETLAFQQARVHDFNTRAQKMLDHYGGRSPLYELDAQRQIELVHQDAEQLLRLRLDNLS